MKRKDIQRGPLGDHLKDDLASGDKVSEADKELKESFSYQGESRWTTSGWPASKYTPKVYTILISRDLKNQKVVIHPPPTIHHQNRKKGSALKIQILIKYKNQMDP